MMGAIWLARSFGIQPTRRLSKPRQSCNLQFGEFIVGRGVVDEGCHEKFVAAEEIVGEKVGEILWCVVR